MSALVLFAKRIARGLGGRQLVLGALGVVTGSGVVAAVLGAWHVALATVFVLLFAIVVGLADVRRRTARQYDMRETRRAATTTEQRLQSTGSSVLAAIERSRSDLIELVADLRADLKERREVVTSADLERSSASIRVAVANQVRQTEAMFQLVQRLNPRAGMPASGGWAMDAENVLVLLDLVAAHRPSLVVELGGGTSTIWLGYALQQAGRGKLVSVEHDPAYAGTTRAEVRRHGLADVVDVRVIPLGDAPLDGHATPWYGVDVFQNLADIDLLVIDGPPQATGRMARFPAVPLLWDKLSPNATVVLDDAHRDDERTSLKLWTAQFPELTVTARSSKDHLVALTRVASAESADTSNNDGTASSNEG